MSRPTVRCETPGPSLRSHGWAARPTGDWRGHGADELGDLQIDGRPTGSTASRFPAEASPVPANHGLRLNDMDRLAPPCYQWESHIQNTRSGRPTPGSLGAE